MDKNTGNRIIELREKGYSYGKVAKELSHANCILTCFSSKIVCGNCGGHYGSKFWHSNSKYKKTIWRCNNKYKGKKKCETPYVTEENIKTKFLKAYAQMISEKDKILATLETSLAPLSDTAKIDEEIIKLDERIKKIEEEARDLVHSNETRLQDQDEFTKAYNKLDKEHQEALEEVARKEDEKAMMLDKRKRIEIFIGLLKDKAQPITEFNEAIWSILVKQAVVNRDGSIRFVFHSGYEALIKDEEEK